MPGLNSFQTVDLRDLLVCVNDLANGECDGSGSALALWLADGVTVLRIRAQVGS